METGNKADHASFLCGLANETYLCPENRRRLELCVRWIFLQLIELSLFRDDNEA